MKSKTFTIVLISVAAFIAVTVAIAYCLSRTPSSSSNNTPAAAVVPPPPPLVVPVVVKAPVTDEKQIRKWIQDLGGNDATVIDTARKGLITVGAPAIPLLKEALDSDDPKTARRAKEVLKTIQSSPQGNVPDASSGPADQPAAPVDEQQIRKLIKDLGGDDATAIDNAKKQLIAIGTPAVPLLKEALDSDNPKLARRAKEVLNTIQGSSSDQADTSTKVASASPKPKPTKPPPPPKPPKPHH